MNFIPTIFKEYVDLLYFVIDESFSLMYQIFYRFDFNLWYLIPFIFGVTICVKWILMPMMNGTGGGGIGTFVNGTRSDSARTNNKKGGKRK